MNKETGYYAEMKQFASGIFVCDTTGQEVHLVSKDKDHAEIKVNNELVMTIHKNDMLDYARLFTQFHEQVMSK